MTAVNRCHHMDTIILVGSAFVAGRSCKRPAIMMSIIAACVVFINVVDTPGQCDVIDDMFVIVTLVRARIIAIGIFTMALIIIGADRIIDFIMCAVSELVKRLRVVAPSACAASSIPDGGDSDGDDGNGDDGNGDDECCICLDTQNKCYPIVHASGETPHTDIVCDACRARLTDCPLCRHPL